jgi:dTDP-glucose 4,6-dehydratase
MKILVTGGCGFIGSNFVRHTLNRFPEAEIINLDKLTYAGNPDNLLDLADNPRHRFIQGDICDREVVEPLFEEKLDFVFNFAAETHVDRSIGDSGGFILTDTYGVHVLLEAARKYGIGRFIQISTDEVYGSIEKGEFHEEDPLKPRNPYSASKAGGDRLAYSYFCTYGIPTLITRASNNLGPFQYPEKVIPLFVTNAIDEQPLPLYGDGQNVRDWLFVDDHCTGLWTVAEKGQEGEVYNIGGGNETKNIDLTMAILKHLNKPESLIQPVIDRLGHDRRYALNCEKLKALGWKPDYDFDSALKKTIDWYLANEAWWRKIKSGDFRKYYEAQYKGREIKST